MAALVVFGIEERLFGVPAEDVERVLPVVDVMPLPESPPVVAGIVDYGGVIVPAIDLRPRFGLPPRPLRLDHRMLVVATRRRLLLLLADRVEGVTEVAPQAFDDMADLIDGAALFNAAGTSQHGLVYVYDIEALLSVDEEVALDAALDRAGVP